MNDKIDKLYEMLLDKPLSQVLSCISPISLEFKDYEGFCIFKYWENPLHKEVGRGNLFDAEITEILQKEGLAIDNIQTIKRQAFEKYIVQRSISKNEVLTLSAKEMEDYLKGNDDLLGVLDIPDGLAPIDLYYRSLDVAEFKANIINRKATIEKQYAVLNSYISVKLGEYKQAERLKCRQKENRNMILKSNKIFIIHGHSEAKYRELAKILKDDFQLEPVILAELPNQGLTIIEKFEKYAKDCSYAFAIFTPDDIVIDDSGRKYFQARPNVIFELGWFYSALGRARVCILDQNSEKSEIFSDLQGVMRLQFNKNIEELYASIRRELEDVGII